MWFKQIQLFQLNTPFKHQSSDIHNRLEPFAFKPCMPSMPSSMGWISPLDEEDAPLTRGLNGCYMLTLQIEEKILPSTVVAQAVKDKIKKIEVTEGRKVRQKEKMTYKDELTQTLLTKAFTKLNTLNAYIDTRNNWLVLNTISPAKTDLFISMFQKAFGECVEYLDTIKPSALLTHWLKAKDYPAIFGVGETCVLQDPEQTSRVVRAQHQDLFASGLQSLLHEGFDVMQLALCWQDRIDFVLADDFTLRSVSLADDDLLDIKETYETRQEKFDADLILMAESLTGLFTDLLQTFSHESVNDAREKLAVAV